MTNLRCRLALSSSCATTSRGRLTAFRNCQVHQAVHMGEPISHHLHCFDLLALDVEIPWLPVVRIHAREVQCESRYKSETGHGRYGSSHPRRGVDLGHHSSPRRAALSLVAFAGRTEVHHHAHQVLIVNERTYECHVLVMRILEVCSFSGFSGIVLRSPRVARCPRGLGRLKKPCSRCSNACITRVRATRS